MGSNYLPIFDSVSDSKQKQNFDPKKAQSRLPDPRRWRSRWRTVICPTMGKQYRDLFEHFYCAPHSCAGAGRANTSAPPRLRGRHVLTKVRLHPRTLC